MIQSFHHINDAWMRNLNAGTERVPIDSLKPHPKNPNRGDVALIAESVSTNGWYGYVIAQRTHDDGTESRTILAGEHRWRALQSQGIETIDVNWVDVPDAEAERLVLVDNKANRAGANDLRAELELLQSVLDEHGSLEGTGTSADEFNDLLQLLGDQALDESEDEEEDLEPPAPKPANVMVVVGSYRIEIQRDRFREWEEDLRQSAGFATDEIEAEILDRLGLDDEDRA